MAKLDGMTESIMFAVLSAPPAALAKPLNTPANRKMNSMMTMFSSPMPRAQWRIFSSKESDLFCTSATVRATMNATTTEIT